MSKKRIASLLGILFVAARAAAGLTYEGVNLAVAEFGYPGAVPGNYGTTYTYPTQAEVNYYQGKGMNTFRLPFLWERLQPDLNAGLDATELGHLTTFVNAATAGGATVILDPHNYAQYLSAGTAYAIGSPEVPTAKFASFWGQLATAFSGNSHVMFGLMNEPKGTPVITTETWFGAAQEAVNAIRAAGATNTILAPGNSFTGAWSWVSGSGNGTPNATVLAAYGPGGLNDPGVNGSAKNLIYEVHQYFDYDPVTGFSYSGTSPTIDYDPAALLADFTNWLSLTGNKGFLGEFGVSANLDGGTAQQDAVGNTLGFLETHSDVWAGWTWWAGGPWWGDYDFSIEPTDNFTTDAPQMAYLAPFLAVPEPSSAELLLTAAGMLLAYAAACTVRTLTSPISSSRASSATRKNPSVESVSATCRLPS